MTKEDLRAALVDGCVLDELFTFTSGDCCEIFKADAFTAGDEILYIPDVGMNGLDTCSVITSAEEIADVLSCCYTGDDFVRECRKADVDEKYAERLFLLCDWQHPSSILGEGWPDDTEV